MERNQGVGFILLMLLFLGWMWISAPTAEEMERQQFIQDSIAQAELVVKDFDETKTNTANATQANQPALSDSLQQQKLNDQYGDWGSMMTGEVATYSISNDSISINFTNQGGAPTTINLGNYKRSELGEDKETVFKPLIMGNDAGRFEYLFQSKSGETISTRDLVFQGKETGDAVNFIATTPGGSKIEQNYKLLPNYTLDYELKIDGVKQLVNPASNSIRFRWHQYLNKLELNNMFEKFYSTVYFKEVDENSDYCNCRGDDIEDDEDMVVEWMAHSNQFFNQSIIPQDHTYRNVYFETKALDDDHEYLKVTKAEGDLALSGDNTESFDFKLYFGPNEFNNLRAFDNSLDEVIPFGNSIFGTINRWVIRPAFDFLSRYIGSKGVVIIVMIFILKMLLYPLMYKMLYSQAKMGALKPKLAGMKEKFKDEPQKQQMETMKLYREYGVSPLGGCMPMILQMPIWYALFRFFPASITFRQESFLWASDLSSYDAIAWLPIENGIPMFGSHISLFTILWAITTVAYTYYNTKHMDLSANPAMKYVQYFMPLTFLIFFNTYASGLTCYMFFSQLFNIMQTVLTKKFVFDEDKIREELEKEKAKPKKKKKGSSFQQRLEEAMKQQQEIQKKKQKKK